MYTIFVLLVIMVTPSAIAGFAGYHFGRGRTMHDRLRYAYLKETNRELRKGVTRLSRKNKRLLTEKNLAPGGIPFEDLKDRSPGPNPKYGAPGGFA